jgi:hypothetical protein
MIDDFVRPELRNRPTKTISPLEKPATTPIHELAAKEEPTFVPPEEVAATESDATDVLATSKEPTGKKRFHLSWPRTKRQRILSGVLAVVLAFGVGAGWTLTHHKRSVDAVAPTHKAVKAVPKPIIYSNLSGLPVADASVNQRPVTGVMVENSLDARPQSGLSQAGVVFEAVAEGGVTRFLALFQDQTPDNVGPIRSARPYYIQWDMGFDAAYAHVGGSPDALADISAWGVKDMNQFSNGGSYHRINTRAAPHNVYTGIATLNQLEAAKGYTSTYNGFPRKADQPYKAPATTSTTKTKATSAPDTRTPVTSIDLALSGPVYNPHYDYNAGTNSYARNEGGSSHTDANTNAQLSPKVVVAMVVQKAQGALDSSGAYYSDYTVVGSGPAYIFQDGVVTQGTWSKADMKSQVTFTDSGGQAIPLNRGQAWVTAVSATNQVTYK